MCSIRSFWAILIFSALFLPSMAIAGDKDIVEILDQTSINWTAQYIEVSGEGVIPPASEEPNRSKATLKARTYAKMSAVAGIYAALDNASISHEAAGKDFLSDMTVRQKIEGYVRNVEIVAERRVSDSGDNVVVVTVRAPMYGNSGIIPAVLDAGWEASTGSKPAKMDKDKVIDDSPSIAADAKGPFTSLILDCTKLKLVKAVLPKIRRPDLSDIFPLKTTKYDEDRIILYGPNVFVSSIEEARKQKRAGDNPLVVKGLARAGIKTMCDIVVSTLDAARIAKENIVPKFIEKGNLIFIVDLHEKEDEE